MRKLCPSCDQYYYGSTCKCGFKESKNTAAIKPSSFQHLRCSYVDHYFGKQCQHIGTISKSTKNETPDYKNQLHTQSYWLCSFHYDNTNNNLTPEKLFSAFPLVSEKTALNLCLSNENENNLKIKWIDN